MLFQVMKRSILLLDHNPIFLHSAAYLLRQEGYRTHTASSGRTAFDLMGNQSFDVIVTELILSGEANGIDVLVQHNRVSPQSAKVLLTGARSSEIVKVCQYIGALYIPKPVAFDDLLHLIEKASIRRHLLPSRPSEILN